MDAVALILGLLLPWALGVAAVLAARDPQRPPAADGEPAWIAGTGFLVGVLLLTAWMRVLSAAGVHFGAAAIALPLAALALALAYVALRRHRARSGALVAGLRGVLAPPAQLGGRARVLWWLIVAWIALRLVLLGIDVALQPLYPWDAWIAWATKARVWYETGRLAPFVDAGRWFAAAGGAWFDASPANPATLPLLQVWACVALGRWDDALMNWPWWQFAVALALIVYGGLRRIGVGPLAALVGAWFAASLPLANVHVALAGYADLPLAVAYAAAALALLHWQRERTLRAAGMVVLLAAACPLLKATGAVYAATLLPGAIVALAPRLGPRIVAAAYAVLLFGCAVLAQTQFVAFGQPLHLDFAPAWPALAEGLFITGNWNLLWYAAIGAAFAAGAQLRMPALLPLAVILGGGIVFALLVFAFPGLALFLADVPTFNRATLHIAPLAVVFTLLAFRAFAQHWGATHPAPAAEPTPASISPPTSAPPSPEPPAERTPA